MARPKQYTDDTVVAVSSTTAKTTLQQRSDRRAIINTIIDNGGRMTLRALDDHYGFDIRDKATELVRLGWLVVVDEPTVAQEEQE